VVCTIQGAIQVLGFYFLIEHLLKYTYAEMYEKLSKVLQKNKMVHLLPDMLQLLLFSPLGLAVAVYNSFKQTNTGSTQHRH